MRVKPNKMITKNTKLPQINFLKKKTNKQTKNKKKHESQNIDRKTLNPKKKIQKFGNLKQEMKYFQKAERPLNICNCGLKKYYH